MNGLTILVVSNTAWSLYNFRMNLGISLKEHGYRVIMVSAPDEYVKRLEQAGFEHRSIEFDNASMNPLSNLELCFLLFRLYRQERPSAVLHFTIKMNIYGSLAAGILRIPCLSNITGLGSLFLHDNFLFRLARYLYAFALRFPRTVFFQNVADRDLFIRKGFVHQAKAALLPGSGIDLRRFRPRESPAKRRYLFVGRLIQDKGIYEFIDAVRLLKDRYPEIEFAVLGALYPHNPTAVSSNTLNDWVTEELIQYLGSTDDVVPELAAAECLVLPSYREGLSRVLLEAAAMALPIVTTDVPGCRDVVDDGLTGFLCQSHNGADLAAKMEKMVHLSAGRRAAMGRMGRKKIESEFDERIVIGLYLKAIDEAIRSA